eukprot:2777366-Pleurochrysis_carterae.AAC.1
MQVIARDAGQGKRFSNVPNPSHERNATSSPQRDQIINMMRYREQKRDVIQLSSRNDQSAET